MYLPGAKKNANLFSSHKTAKKPKNETKTKFNSYTFINLSFDQQ